MSRTSDLAAAYLTAAGDLDNLYLKLVQDGQYGLANQVAQAELELKQASTTLYATDALDELADGSPAVATLENLTSTISQKADAIASAEGRVTIITGLAASLVTAASDFGAGNISGGISAISDAAGVLGKL